MSWLLLAILAPALYGVTNVIDKVLIEKRIKEPLFLTVFGGCITFLFGCIILCFAGFGGFTLFQIMILLAAGMITEFSLVPYYKALALEDASRVIPLYQVIPIFVLVLSYLFLGETLSKIQILSFFLILVGGFILSIEKFSKKIFALRRSFWYMMLSSLLYASTLILFKFVIVENHGFWNSLGYDFLGGGLGAVILYCFYRKRLKGQATSISKSSWNAIALNEAVYAVARLCTFYAAILAPVSLVTVLSGFQPLFVLIYGLVLSIWFSHILTEDIRKSTIGLKIAAIVLIFLGVWWIGG